MCKRVNAVSLNCGTREVEENIKRWKDTKRAVKKKERKRKSGLQKLADDLKWLLHLSHGS